MMQRQMKIYQSALRGMCLLFLKLNLWICSERVLLLKDFSIDFSIIT